MLDTIFAISLNIIVIWGAISVILILFILFKLLLVISKLNNLINDIIENYKFAKHIMSLPFSVLKKIFKN